MYTTNEIRKRIFSRQGFHRLAFVGFLLLLFNNVFAQQPIPVNLPESATGNPNSSVSLPITVGDLTGRNVFGYTAFIQYDNSVLRATGVDVINSLSETLPPLSVQISDNGSLGFINVQAQNNNIALTGSGVLLNLIFDVVGNPADTTNIGLSFFFNVGSPPSQTSGGKFTVNSPDIEVSPLELDFGTTFLDSLVERTVQIDNNGSYELTVDNISVSGVNASDFSLPGFTPPVVIPIGANNQLTVRFIPNSIGIKNAILNINSNDPTTPNVRVDLSGEGVIRPVPDIFVSPELIDFGEIVEKTTASRQIEIENQGTGVLEISDIVIENENSGDFSTALKQFPVEIEPGNSLAVDVVFNPTGPGTSEAKLAIISNDPDESRAEIELKGVATPELVPEITVAPDSIGFGEIYVDSTIAQILTIQNIGTADLVVSELNLVGQNSNQFEVENISLPLIVQPLAGREIMVFFKPDSAGLKTAALEIVSNDRGMPFFSVPLTGEAKRESNISLDVSSIQFEDVFSDSAESASFRIKNSGNANLEVFSIETAGENPEDFQIEGVSPPFILLPGDSQNVGIVFSPKSAGESNAIIEIRTNDPNNPVFSIPVTGTSLPPLMPKIYVSADTLTFGTLEVEADSTIQLYIGNSGDANLQIDAISINNQILEDFRFVAPELPFVISPGDSQKIDVIFSPNRNGYRYANLVIASNAPKRPVTEVFLQGDGILPFILLTNIVTPNNSVACGDSITIEVETFIGGAIEPINILCRINEFEFSGTGENFSAKIPVLSDSFLVKVECFVTDGMGRMRTSADSIYVLKPKPLICNAEILLPQKNGLTLLDSIDVVVRHGVLGGSPPISVQCRINGIPAVQEDSLFRAKIPVNVGENLIVATALADDACGFKAICSDSITVTRISAASCQVEIVTPANDQLICSGIANVEAKLRLPNFIDMLSLTTMIDDSIVFMSEDSLFASEVQLQSGVNKIIAKAIVEFENGMTIECKDSVNVRFDDIIPVCDFWPDAGKIVGVLTDSLSGLAKIEILQIINARLVVDEFQPGTQRVDFEVVPKDPEKSIVFNMRVTDVCGNSVICDPVYINLNVEDSNNRHLIDFYSSDKFFTVKNKGVEMIRCKLNQKEFFLFTEQIAGRPKPNSYRISKYGETTFDLSSELQAGNNLLEVQLIGYNGASVELFLADLKPDAIDYQLEINSLPQDFVLRPNYPNPFNPATNIEFEVPVKYTQGVRVKVQIYNILGEVVNELLDEYKTPGVYTLVWDGANKNGLKLASGVYILHMQADTFSMQRRMLLVK